MSVNKDDSPRKKNRFLCDCGIKYCQSFTEFYYGIDPDLAHVHRFRVLEDDKDFDSFINYAIPELNVPPETANAIQSPCDKDPRFCIATHHFSTEVLDIGE
jgi:hypothetical protein